MSGNSSKDNVSDNSERIRALDIQDDAPLPEEKHKKEQSAAAVSVFEVASDLEQSLSSLVEQFETSNKKIGTSFDDISKRLLSLETKIRNYKGKPQ
ncbi:Hypothetical protein PP7435_CHR2-0574 [Komagataella phaffii CBS 7435]|uniref:Uncharacterized protein n=2 Tax=Komagataella phaffii TaxID=460519 RepID=C4R1H9_KOMPG|nr:Hypothetical protein PAS_chr2-1_0705 [Komagataella phaffii GS115]CAH2448116.1 Hypothetical protein BQ9382_C2-3120 [Komagataella phaffii CBS 7435]CAY69353.1 Hypothetical protein PAS_chr2-1_0705 [Komagataella phaffii GS115]CCA38261.1 Hypothetical protein PP7435_CHR2-0574 [Komagataella phaffii CBS 7435]